MKYNSRRKIDQKLRDVNSLIRLPKDYPWVVLSDLIDDLQQFLHQDDVDLIRTIVRDRDLASYFLLDEYWGLQGINSQCVDTIPEIRAKYQLVALLKKYRFETDLKTRVDSAKTKFKQAEDLCRDYNHSGYLKLVSNGDFAASILTDARCFLSKLLGETSPTKSVIVDWSRHGPGSSLSTSSGLVSSYHKYSEWPYTTTAAALPVARFLIQSDKRWLGALENSYREKNKIPMFAILNQERFWDDVFQIVPGNRITTVPKNAQTERTIAIEPLMNLMLQLGVDGFIRKRLKRWDIDLNSQEKNQNLAHSGSISGNYATFDLSAASDTISLKLCQLLLPPEWYSYLLKLRSPTGVFDDISFVYEKISSMGNGYTFALESAIFAAVCYAAINADKGFVDFKKDLSVFGDDLIVKTEHAASCLQALSICGFKLNTDKSFFQGKVRESCGCDWYEGKSIRPVFLKQLPSSLQALYIDRNRLKRQLELNWGLTESNTQIRLDNWIPEFFREFKGPYSDESFDSYLHDSGCRNAVYRHGMYEYIRFVKKPKEVEAQDFFFRKLMHNLKGESNISLFEGKIAVGGSRFTVIRRNAETVRVSYSCADHWCNSYHFLRNPKKLS